MPKIYLVRQRDEEEEDIEPRFFSSRINARAFIFRDFIELNAAHELALKLSEGDVPDGVDFIEVWEAQDELPLNGEIYSIHEWEIHELDLDRDA